ncbi:LytTR family DNA-binding domain-containing protein [Spirosoma sp.]|uniref:LytTR family DNA-binding domain-containing protein n=1 Tax=Spirosoma sp. TaxID=1899569 RepID=UPI00260BCC6D|nr:LytTR family DNA-binding domain-containing protein [Spirosoma sp.]MCX6216584.1 LytTR family DNA-binding domain-containing protein [Spirosoma sp.]
MNDLLIETGQGKSKRIFPASQILYVEANINYSLFHLTDGSKVLTSRHLGYYAKLLSEFARINKSYLINPYLLKKWKENPHSYRDGAEVTLTNGVRLGVARRRVQEAKAKLGI